MSGSETGVMTSREPFAIGVQTSPHMIQNMRLAYGTDGTAVYKPVAGSPPAYQSAVSGGGGNGEGQAVMPHNLNMNVMGSDPSMKKKRGRPRKYGPDGAMSLSVVTPPPPATVPQSTTGTFSPPAPAGGLGSPSSSSKKARGRPPGSSKKQQIEALGSAGVGFTPHIMTVKAGEDVSSKIMSFSQNGPRAVCILSANGAISNVTLRQAATSGGTATYEENLPYDSVSFGSDLFMRLFDTWCDIQGRFDILSLCGSFLLTEVGGQRSRTGGLSVTLAGPDGRVLGGCVAGLLTAATPVQVIMGSFIADGGKESKAVNQMEQLSAPSKLAPVGGGGGATGATSPPSHGTLSESSGGPGSPLNHSTGAYNNSNPQGMSTMPWR
ncbi:hypothetical protein TEA_023547 [Camellia sinensis var. sinensis]|uniref:AT-hook motif nuclear-localized protein n=1 Tax=Camellia sinensis var. sinensis TaxID=542762 RepID=A0A4S4EB55_CAMSN|nr:hypothetical protein TEA_023547 [Camellia sinensis var. sinensis]